MFTATCVCHILRYTERPTYGQEFWVMSFILRLTLLSALATRLDVCSFPFVFAITHKSRSVQIFGRFEVLRNGVTLVDLPGHGDTNNER